MPKFDLSTLVRPKIFSLEPYRCARDDFTEGILLDANENTNGPSLSPDQLKELVALSWTSGSEAASELELNRYPDPHQVVLKTKIAEFRNREAVPSLPHAVQVPPFAQEKATSVPTHRITVASGADKVSYKNICLGVGSDESIDALIRTVCTPGKDKLLICPPTYGMYKISSQINDVDIVSVPLDFSTFDIQSEEIISAITKDASIKLVFVTSPGNPTAKLVSFDKVKRLLDWGLEHWNGIVVIDEAYVDFATIGSSFSVLVNQYPNLVVFQTLSKSFGLAGIRLGITFASEELSTVLNALKAPYNISSLTAQIASAAVEPSNIEIMRQMTRKTNAEKFRLIGEFAQIEQFGNVIGGLDANFILIQVLRGGKPSSEFAKQVYEKMAVEKKVVVRFRGNEPGCIGALRVTVGTKEENKTMVEKFKETFAELK